MTIGTVYSFYNFINNYNDNNKEIEGLINEANSKLGPKLVEERFKLYENAFQLLCKDAIDYPKVSIKDRELKLIKILFPLTDFCDSEKGSSQDCASLMELSLILQCRHLGFSIGQYARNLTPWQFAPTLEDLTEQLNADTLGRSHDIKALCDQFDAVSLQTRFSNHPGKSQMFIATIKVLYPCYYILPSYENLAKQLHALYNELEASNLCKNPFTQ